MERVVSHWRNSSQDDTPPDDLDCGALHEDGERAKPSLVPSGGQGERAAQLSREVHSLRRYC